MMDIDLSSLSTYLNIGVNFAVIVALAKFSYFIGGLTERVGSNERRLNKHEKEHKTLWETIRAKQS